MRSGSPPDRCASGPLVGDLNTTQEHRCAGEHTLEVDEHPGVVRPVHAAGSQAGSRRLDRSVSFLATLSWSAVCAMGVFGTMCADVLHEPSLRAVTPRRCRRRASFD